MIHSFRCQLNYSAKKEIRKRKKKTSPSPLTVLPLHLKALAFPLLGPLSSQIKSSQSICNKGQLWRSRDKRERVKASRDVNGFLSRSPARASPWLLFSDGERVICPTAIQHSRLRGVCRPYRSFRTRASWYTLTTPPPNSPTDARRRPVSSEEPLKKNHSYGFLSQSTVRWRWG